MADHLTPAQRSQLMSRVRSKSTQPEMLVRQLLYRLGYRFRIHVRALPGTPDIVLRKHGLVIFVHGCFWHGHSGCPRSNLPKTRKSFWEAKIHRNIERDSVAATRLGELGFRVLALWECELKDLDALAVKLAEHLPPKAHNDGAQIENG